MGRICLITGGNSGIGYAAAGQLLKAGHKVILACRDKGKGEGAVKALEPAAAAACSSVEYIQLDLASLSSVRSCANDVLSRYPRLDVLCCNAAVVPAKVGITQDGHELTFQSNHLGHFLLAHLLLPALLRSDAGRIVVVSSELHRKHGGLPPSPTYMTADIFRAQGEAPPAQQGTAGAQAPGHKPGGAGSGAGVLGDGRFIPSTNLSRNANFFGRLVMRNIMPLLPFAVNDATGAARVVSVCVGKEADGVTGAYFSKGVQTPSSAESLDVAKAQELWDVSLAAAGITQPYVPAALAKE
ncbi:MAG: hypothetical protein WDW38_000568 [Sanguina aurantia]